MGLKADGSVRRAWRLHEHAASSGLIPTAVEECVLCISIHLLKQHFIADK